MRERKAASFFHIGVCSSDIERSIRFYSEALDFKPSHHVDPGPEFGALAGASQHRSRAHFLTRGDLMIELVAADVPGAAPDRGKAPGLHHLSFVTADVDALAERIVRAGGRILIEKLKTPDGDLVFCADPDGVRLELWGREA